MSTGCHIRPVNLNLKMKEKKKEDCHVNLQHRKPKYQGSQQQRFFFLHWIVTCYKVMPCHLCLTQKTLPSQFQGEKKKVSYHIFSILDTKTLIFQRNKKHYSGMWQILPSWPYHHISRLASVVSVSTQESTGHSLQIPFHLPKVLTAASPMQSIWTHKSLSIPQCKNYIEIYSEAQNYFLSFTSAITD